MSAARGAPGRGQVCVWGPAHDPTHACAGCWVEEAPLGPPVLAGFRGLEGGLPGIQGALAPPSLTNHHLGVELRFCGRCRSCSRLQTWGRRSGMGRERVALQRSRLVSERRAPWWGSEGRVRPGWEAGFSKCPIPGYSRAPAHLSFCRMSCRISGFPMFPGKSAGEDLTESPPSVGCPPVLRHSVGDAP